MSRPDHPQPRPAIPSLPRAAPLLAAMALVASVRAQEPQVPPALQTTPPPPAATAPSSPAGIAVVSQAPPAPASLPVRLEEPVVRIGLSVPPTKAAVSATGRYRVLNRRTREAVARPAFEREEVLLVVDRPRAEALATVYRVQVASTADREAADTLQAQLTARLSEPVTVEYFPDRRTYRVRVGQARTPQEASALADRLRAEGMEDVWIVEEPPPAEGAQSMRLVDSEYRDTPLGADGVWVVPEERSDRVMVEGSEYKGILEVFVGRAGALTVVNHLPLEEYLRGVVPNEMGPGLYPELEALKAQAVAARTYAYKNLGQFGDDGYDICDTMRCQVYKGYLTEQPLTNDAVRETRGEILTWEGKPINALYTSSCGGHTEDGFRVFEEEKGPYLRGVPCYPEREQARASALLLSTRRKPPEPGEGLDVAAYETAVLMVLGVLPPEAADRAWLGASADTQEIRAWTFRALKLIGKRPGRHDFASAPIPTRAALARYWVQVFSWEERVRRLLSEPDVEGLLAFPDASEVPANDRARVAYLLREGWYEADGGGRLRPLAPPTRREASRTLYRILERYESLGLESGAVLGKSGRALDLRAAGERKKIVLAAEPFLFRRAGGVVLAAAELPLRPGDSVVYHSGRTGADLLLLEDLRRGASDDRFTPNLWWEVRLTREDADKRLRKRVEVGRLIDIVPVEYGPSQRVTRLKVIGSRGESILMGFRIRVALGLREDLFVLDRQYDTDGNVTVFVFSGKGWGHGVGLCQVGAYGMALRGKTYRDILTHYYPGAALGRAF